MAQHSLHNTACTGQQQSLYKTAYTGQQSLHKTGYTAQRRHVETFPDHTFYVSKIESKIDNCKSTIELKIENRIEDRQSKNEIELCHIWRSIDMKWPDIIQIIARQYGATYSDEDVAALSFDEKSNWLRRNPVTAARHFLYRLNSFFQDVLKSKAKPLGEIVDYAIRVEFQSRGSPHAHCVLWVKDAPKYGVDSNEDVCAFIDQYVSCAIPANDCKLKELVLMVQRHRHSSYCKRNKHCRFNFPHPPSPSTVIASPCNDSEVYEKAQSVLSKVRQVLPDCDPNATIDDVLTKASVDRDEYVEALQVTKGGNVVLLKREPNEQNINNYNASVMVAWQANMDIQMPVPV